MGAYNIVLLVAVFAFVPFWMHVLNGYNYYYDYTTGLFEPDPPDLFDFIVGKLCTVDYSSAHECGMDWGINYDLLYPSGSRFSWSRSCQPTFQEQ